jgi:outer membrane protein assembly factor BamB
VDYFYDSITISPMGRYISVIFRIATKEKFEDYLELFDNKGNLLWKKQVIPGEYYLKFSKNEKYIVANNTNNNLYLFDVKSGELLWEYQDSALRTWSKNPCDITNKGDVLVETYYPGKKKIILFNKSGQVLWSKEFIYTAKFYHRKFEAKFIDNGQSILVNNNGHINKYSIW